MSLLDFLKDTGQPHETADTKVHCVNEDCEEDVKDVTFDSEYMFSVCREGHKFEREERD